MTLIIFLAAFDLPDITVDYSQDISFKISPNVKRKNATQYLALSTFPIDPKVPIDKASKGNLFFSLQKIVKIIC